MPFLDHLEELRWRILKSLVAVLFATVAGWLIVEYVDVIGLLMRPIIPLLPDGKLKFTSPTEPFLITLKFAFVLGLLLASPVVIYQAWAFLAPALYDRERRLIVPALSVGVVLFLTGAVVAYLWVLPHVLRMLFSFQQQALAPIITADGYFAFAAQLMIAIGLAMELPLVVVILTALGLVTPQFLGRNRRYAVAVAAVAAALLAPPDAVSMLVGILVLLLLYEVSIWCAWVVTKRRARREHAAADAAGSVGLLVVLLVAAAAGAHAQGRLPSPRQGAQRDTTPGRPADSAAVQGRSLDTATARKLGLPTGPSRSVPPSDATIDSLLKLGGYRVTKYVADTLVVEGGDSSTIFLRGQAYVEREGTKLESDSIAYRQTSCRLDATGDPRLFDQTTVLVGEAMRYDTCVKRGTVRNALTDVQQGGAIWYVRGALAVDSGSTRVYGANSEITSDDHPVPDYHFATGEVKWLNKNIMVGRPAVLYVHDVPIMWLPFIFQDIRKGRRSGLLIPRFGLNDIVRPTRNYERHVANIGFYLVPNDYMDLLVKTDWYAARYMTLSGQVRYRWLDRFVNGSLSLERYTQLGQPGHSIRLGWQHSQSFSSRTHFTASIDYSNNPSVIQTNTVNPYLATARLSSSMSFDKRFGWGALNIGGSRGQEIGTGATTQDFPKISLAPSPVNFGSAITWSPSFAFDNQQNFRQAQAPFVVAGDSGAPDTLRLFSDNRTTTLSLATPLRIGRWVWSNSFSMNDRTSNARQEYPVVDSTAPGGIRRLLYARTFSTQVDWQTGVNLPSLFSNTWKLQPGIAIVNQTSAGPYLIRNQFTGGQWLHQGKRLQFSASIAPTLFGFFPGFGPLARIRHSIAPIVNYAYAPGSAVSDAFARAVNPTGTALNAKSDPQQTITLGLSQNFEAKLKPAAGDTTGKEGRKIRLLGITTSSLSYNFEQAKQPHRTGWLTRALTNTFASDLLPGFNLSVTHDLWQGQVGTDSAKFSPFLTNINASFAITPATIRGIASVLGLGGKAPTPSPAAPAPGADTTGQGGTGQFGQKDFQPRSVPGAGKGFNLSVTYSGTRTRPVPVVDTLQTTVPFTPGTSQKTLSLGLSFSPTAHWSATWNSMYDFTTQQFGLHVIHLERDLHRWHASFSFSKSPNGNFAFTFYVALLDQPDIKFDYEQQSLLR
jgi:sec-independent protein translocase protein TatC